MQNASKSKRPLEVAAPEWVTNREAWENFTHENFSTFEDAAELYGSIQRVLEMLFKNALNDVMGSDFYPEHSLSMLQLLTLKRTLGTALGILDDAGVPLPPKKAA